MSPFVWEETPEQAFTKAYAEWERRLNNAIELLMLRYAAEIEQYMKQEAVWKDRTGNARQSLYAEVTIDGQVYILGFDYGVEYGFWLEFAHQGRFAIIAPTADIFWPRFVNDLQALLQ